MMTSSSKTEDKQLEVRTTASPSIIIRTNILLPNPIEIYIPDDNNSVPYAFMLGVEVFRRASRCEKSLLSGYFSALCAAFPNLKTTACEILESLGYQVKETMVPSKKDVKYTPLSQSDKRTEILSFAQLTYVPFINYHNGVRPFWEHVAEKAQIPLRLFCESDVKTLLLAFKLSRLSIKLAREVYLSLQALSETCSPLGFVFFIASKRYNYEREFRDSIYRTYVHYD